MVSKTSVKNKLSMLVLFLGILVMSLQLALVFADKIKI
jgi:hypothetical protein